MASVLDSSLNLDKDCHDEVEAGDCDCVVKTLTGSTSADSLPFYESDSDAESEQFFPAEAELPGESVRQGLESNEVLSIGSAFHDTGLCKPCAWYWKPQGCKNGRSCEHCHLCPKGEVRRRKRDKKKVQLPPGAALQKEVEKASGPSQSAAKQPKARQEVQSQPAALLPQHMLAMQAQVLQTQQQQLQMMQLSIMQQQNCLQQLAFAAQGCLSQGLASEGSKLHGTRACKPCAWFWKPGGCESGVKCQFCHLCQEGEIKHRKKVKAAMLRRSSHS